MKYTPARFVLIADDDEDDRFLLKLAFEQHSPECNIRFTNDGQALLEELTYLEEPPCLIILDLNMPRLDGFEALRTLRENPVYQETPIVILTTSNNETDQQLAHELGANDFITKPLNIMQLGYTVGQLRKAWHLDQCI